ncbi:gastric triacylglycerol lipase-like [Mizuhopecten yessoensis]|uniref:Lipase n=1 Tax=Mizuhopecten yessoensis TaxID=6573 RepID=A0A210QVF0_MIZYE|nr:gastric triacylglycerol lipase-like [Mizuhopecten yessoensis]OWF52686.1 Lysosomal acid lipase/cholesteryl ester hydrolase [Mizuhopecten yessoensis]
MNLLLLGLSVSSLIGTCKSFQSEMVANVLRNWIHSDPEVFMNVSQLVTSKGYPCEEYTIETKDGYLLGIQRIPHGRDNRHHTHNSQPRPPVFLQHGLLGTSADWVINLANESLGFQLADAGFDVWMGNSRGNTYSTRHVKLSPHCDKFWEFSFDEMAKYDVPAVLNHILTVTEQNNLFYIGHSQGTLINFAMLSENPELAKKIKLFVALGPVTVPAHIISPLKYLANVPDQIAYLLFGRKDFLPNDLIIKILGDTLCKETVTRAVCSDILFLCAGYDIHNLNKTRLPVYISHTPAGTSMQDMIHFSQMIRSKQFQKYDYGSVLANKQHYGQATPPVYDVSKVTTPVVLYWAEKDWLAVPQDVKILQSKLPNVRGSYEIKDWNHLDFIWGVNSYNVLYKDIIQLLLNATD